MRKKNPEKTIYMIRILMSVLLLATLLHACTKPSSIGTDFIDDDMINVEVIDTVTFNAKTVNPGPIVIYDSVPTLSRYMAGNLDDPIFGKSSSQIFGQLRMVEPGIHYFENATLDSVVLSLGYDTSSTYGNFEDEAIDVEVYRLMEDMEFEAEYMSDQTFMTDNTPIGQQTGFVPNLTKERVIFVETEPGVIDTVTLSPRLRLQLDDAIGEEIMGYDSLTLTDSDNFIELFKGINVRVNSDNSMHAFNLLSGSSRLTIYYKEDDTLSRQFHLGFTNRSSLIPSYQHDFSSSAIESFIDNETDGDSLLFTQGMAGVDIELEFPYLSELENGSVNYAELTFTVAELPGDDLSIFPPVEQLTGVYEDDMGINRLVLDAFLAEVENNNPVFIEEAFGGFIQEEMVNGQKLQHYSLKITNQVSRMLEGSIPEKIKIRPRLKNIQADRVVIYGPGHSEHPMEFKLFLSTQ